MAHHLTPPALTRSPTPHNDLGYPSPPMMVAQQYKIASAYSTGPSCTVPTTYETEHSLPALETMSHPEWPSSSAMHTASTSSGIPSVITAEYDHFPHYDQVTPNYHDDVYQTAQHLHAPSVAHHPPSPPEDEREMTPRIKTEYPHPADPSRYSSPRPVGPAFVTDAGTYPTATTAGYLQDNQPTAWNTPKSEYPTPGPALAPLYQNQHHQHQHGQDGQEPQGITPDVTAAAFLDDPRRLSRSSRQSRKQSSRKMTSKEEANYQCEHEGCGKLFGRSYNYKAHLDTHDKQRAYPFPCLVKDCSKKFVRKTDLQRHNTSVHVKEKPHKCEYCGRQFARKDTLRRHMDDGCSKRFSCTIDLGPEPYTTGPTPEGLHQHRPPPPINAAPTGPLGHHMLPPYSSTVVRSLPSMAAITVPSSSGAGPIAPPLRPTSTPSWPRGS